MAKTTPLKLVALFFLFLLLFSDGLKITTRLIHRDSIFSPHFNASLTATDLAKRMVGASLARHSASVQGITPGVTWSNNKRHIVFYVNFSIGDPPVPQLAVMDTGSNLLWVRCPPCTHCSSLSGVTYFYTWHSKTYSPLPCKENCAMCTPAAPWPKPPDRKCMFKVDYFNAQTTGVYATEQLTFRTNNDDMKTTVVPNVLFGCTETETGNNDIDPSANGIMGLGRGFGTRPEDSDNLIYRLGGKFSYCIGSTSNRSYPHNSLSFGDAARFIGKFTVLIYSSSGYYFTNLEYISVGAGKKLNIDYDAFNHGTVVDSGSEISFLRPQAIDAVQEEIRVEAALMNVDEVRSPLKTLELCYRGKVDKEGRRFNSFGFHFVDGAELEVDRFGMFLQVSDDIFCLAIARSKTFNIIGVNAQQGYNVGYQLGKDINLLYFQKVDCGLL